MRTKWSLLSCALSFLRGTGSFRSPALLQRCAALVYAALPALGTVNPANGQSPPPDEQGPPVTVLVSGFPVTTGTAINWAAYPNAVFGVVGSLDNFTLSSVITLPLDHATMTLDDWLVLGVEPAQAASLIASLAPSQSLAAMIGADGSVQSVVVVDPNATSTTASMFVVATPPGTTPPTQEELAEAMRRFLRELYRFLGLPMPDLSEDW